MWSWILTAVGVVGLYCAGKKYAFGWLIGLFAQVLWVSYALATDQFGFLVSAFAYGFMYTKNFLLWRKQKISEDVMSNAE